MWPLTISVRSDSRQISYSIRKRTRSSDAQRVQIDSSSSKRAGAWNRTPTSTTAPVIFASSSER